MGIMNKPAYSILQRRCNLAGLQRPFNCLRVSRQPSLLLPFALSSLASGLVSQ